MNNNIEQIRELKAKSFVDVVRHIRPTQVDKNISRIVFGPNGGVTIKFSLHQPSSKLVYWYAVCRDDENFSFDIANNIVEGRSQMQEPIKVEKYDRDIGLVENVIADLKLKLQAPDISPDEIDVYDEFIILHRKLTRIMNANKRLMDSVGDKFPMKPASYSGK